MLSLSSIITFEGFFVQNHLNALRLRGRILSRLGFDRWEGLKPILPAHESFVRPEQVASAYFVTMWTASFSFSRQ